MLLCDWLNIDICAGLVEGGTEWEARVCPCSLCP